MPARIRDPELESRFDIKDMLMVEAEKNAGYAGKWEFRCKACVAAVPQTSKTRRSIWHLLINGDGTMDTAARNSLMAHADSHLTVPVLRRAR